jgi:hypothetical protein
VFGAYVVSLEAALLESIGYYGPMGIFTTGYLSNMVLPIQVSIYVWILGSVLLLCGQLVARPIHRDTVLIGVGSLAVSLLSQLTVGASLLNIKVPWFVSYLELTDATKLLVGTVSAFGLVYVVPSPLMWRKESKEEVGWRKKPAEEIADDLRNLLVTKALVEVSDSLGIDRATMKASDMSIHVRKGSIAVAGPYTTRGGKRGSFTATFNQPKPNLEECTLLTVEQA